MDGELETAIRRGQERLEAERGSGQTGLTLLPAAVATATDLSDRVLARLIMEKTTGDL